jgi:cytochrome c biogenesis protein CcmG/thiol:disulfide interchange protein DsbE
MAAMGTRSRPSSSGNKRALRKAQRRRATLRTWLLISGGVALFAALFIWSLAPKSGGPGPARLGGSMDDFVLADLQGHPVRLSDYAGQVILVNGWATWCPSCLSEMPGLQAFYDAHRDEGFALLAINAGEDQPSVSAFVKRMGFTFPILLDPGERVLAGLGIPGLPTSFIVGRDGKVKYIHPGGITTEVLERRVTPLLAAR